MGYDPLIKSIYNVSRDILLIIEWGNGLKISGTRDVIFETNNGYEDTDPRYLEFDAVVIEVQEILSVPKDEGGEAYHWLKQNRSNLIAVSLYEDPPIRVSILSGKEIWRSNQAE